MIGRPAPDEAGRPRLVLAGPSGNVVHVSTCKVIRRSAIVTLEQEGPSLAQQIGSSGLLPCKVCKPIRRLDAWKRFG